MNHFITYAVESSLILIVLYIFYILFYAKDRNFQFNRFYLLAAPLLAVLLPLLHIPLFNPTTLPELQTIQQAVQLPEITVPVTTATSSGISPLQILLIIYLAGAGFFIFRFIYQTILLFRIIGFSNKTTDREKGYVFVETAGKFPTCSFFSYLLWDDTLSLGEKEKEQILHHEEAHIRQRHSYDVIYLEIMRALFWFNPAIHGFKKALSDVHEYLADEQASIKIGRQSYLSLLAKQILLSFNFSVTNNFHQSQTSKRMKMIKNYHRKHPLWVKLLAVIPAIAALFFVFSCDLGNGNIKTEETIIHNTSEKIKQDVDATNDDVFTVVEEQPVPYGGLNAFYEFISEVLNYPEEARQNKVQGKVFVQFVVDEEGNVTNVKAVKGIGFGCDEEAERAVKNSQKWKPGRQHGKAVKVRMILPITFSLSPDGKPDSDGESLMNGSPPIPMGHLASYMDYIAGKLGYPEGFQRKGVEKKVPVVFTVDQKGRIMDVKVEQKDGMDVDDQTIRIIENGPKSDPAGKTGNLNKMHIFIPLKFKSE